YKNYLNYELHILVIKTNQSENWVNVEIIVGIPLLIKAIILGVQNILEVLLEDIGIFKMESIFLHTNTTIIPHSVLYVSLSYYIINPYISASTKFNDCFSSFHVIF
ncbi:HN1_G0000530.mRNA.1.CDS.1, partial [Saccharomyces cerevisiae]